MRGLLVLLALVATTAQAEKDKIPPARAKAIQKENKSFDACKKHVAKQKSLSKEKRAVMLSACKESFPGASLYIECKKKAIKAAKDKTIELDKAVKQCERHQLAAAFDPQSPLPYYVEGGQMFFAGIGMNRPGPIAQLDPPNFNCAKLASSAKDLKSAAYILVGNHPQAFAAFTQMKGPEITKTLAIKPNKKGVDAKGFGRVFDDPKKPQAAVFFPTAPCEFEGKLGEIYAGLSAYYLLDANNNTATPYFGIAYYKAGQSKASAKAVLQDLTRMLGSGYKTIQRDDNVSFVAAGALTERDEENDPKNLCKAPREHRLLAVLQLKNGAPDYLVLANIKNLCDFGDKLSHRLVE